MEVLARTLMPVRRMYRRDASTWLQTAKLTAAVPAVTEFLSSSIALSGDPIALGAPNANSGNLARSGAVDYCAY